MATMSPFDGLNSRDLLCEFLRFSRFEFTLKEQGFMYVNRNGRTVRTGAACGPAAASLSVDAGSDLAHAIDYSTTIHHRYSFGWVGHVCAPRLSSNRRAIDAIQRVRNHLSRRKTYPALTGRDEKPWLSLLSLTLASCKTRISNNIRR